MELLDQVRTTIARHALASAGTRVIVALSGGPDSVALVHLLSLARLGGRTEARGAGAPQSSAAGRRRGRRAFLPGSGRATWAFPWRSNRPMSAAMPAGERCSIEDAAHELRYEFLSRARVHFRADCVALGHTRDDQAETFLLRLMRGAGARGLAGMHPRRDRFIRPLLECRRADLRGYLAAQGVRFVHDASNDDVAMPRNRVRAELLPLLADAVQSADCRRARRRGGDCPRGVALAARRRPTSLMSAACRREGDSPARSMPR